MIRGGWCGWLRGDTMMRKRHQLGKDTPLQPVTTQARPVTTQARPVTTQARPGFTLIELLTVVAIISLLMSILMPSLSRAREQAKGVHCAARLKDFANGFAAYENVNHDNLPPCEWYPDPDNEDQLRYGWSEVLYDYVWKERVYRPELNEIPQSFPVQRHVAKYNDYFICRSSRSTGVNSGHYRVYLPSWLYGSYRTDSEGRVDVVNTVLDPRKAGSRGPIPPRMPLIGDANASSLRIDTSFIDMGEANAAGINGMDGNRFSDRHYGGTNYLFQDFHVEWRPQKFRDRLSVDIDLNGINDVDVGN